MQVSALVYIILKSSLPFETTRLCSNGAKCLVLTSCGIREVSNRIICAWNAQTHLENRTFPSRRQQRRYVSKPTGTPYLSQRKLLCRPSAGIGVDGIHRELSMRCVLREVSYCAIGCVMYELTSQKIDPSPLSRHRRRRDRSKALHASFRPHMQPHRLRELCTTLSHL